MNLLFIKNMPIKVKENMKKINQFTTVFRKKDELPFKVGNLIFEDKHSYKKFRKLDKYIKIVDKCVEKGHIQVEDFFNKLRLVEVKQTRHNGYLELFDLFPNSRNFLFISPDVIYDKTLNKIGSRFFRKFDVINERGERVNIFNGHCFETFGHSIFGLVDK